MGKIQFCRICRTKENLKFTAKNLREFNRQQLLSAQETRGSETTDKASQKLLRTTPTLGNICKDCDDRVQIFHRLDDGNQSCDSDIEIDVVDSAVTSLPPTTSLPPPINNCRPDTPIIVDDDDMLYDLFMQKVDQQRQQRQLPAPLPQMQTQNEPQPQQAFINHFDSQYTPPQSTGGSEGEDSKVIEVLTSRESTPASSICKTATPVPGPAGPPDIVDNQGHRIVAIIDLDGEEDTNMTEHDKRERVTTPPPIVENQMGPLDCSQHVVASAKFKTETINDNQIQLTPVKSSEAKTTPHCEDDDEEIVFRRVDPQEETPSKKKKRKSYDDKQLRLVASLSLVSSDSETEDPANKSSPIMPNSFICKECHINLPDKESLTVHERVHEGIKCPVCHFGFPHEKRLVHHMRYKHRAYNGNVLSEKTRAPQDSAMTIRLRYMQHSTFYECQLCGRIDEVFKDHKDHVINKHPVESKTLKDPIIKQLKCPICKTKCGTQYLSLCRHLLDKHEYGQYKSHLRELLHVNAFGWNSAARQQEVAKTARIYQFSKRNTFFFECKICHKVVAGYLNHMKHISNHSKLELKVMTEIKTAPPPPPSSTTKSKNKTAKEKLGKILKSTKKSKQIPQKDLKSCKKPAKSVNTSQTLKKSLVSKKSPIVKLKIPKMKSKESVKPADKPVIAKPKTTEIVKTNEKSNKRKRKDNSSTKPQLKKVKVKAPTRQINLQTYTCNYCSEQLKGFILYNTHMQHEHMQAEFKQCTKCTRSYFDQTLLKTHIEQCCSNKQKRKYNSGKVGNQSSKSADVDCNAKRKRVNEIKECDEQQVPEETTANNAKNEDNLPVSEGEEEKQTMWLKDLLKLYESKHCNDSIISTVTDSCSLTVTDTAAVPAHEPQPNEHSKRIVQKCCYCLHLFASMVDLKDHTRQEHSAEDEVLIKYTPFKP